MKLEVHARSSVRSKARKFHYSTVQYTTNNYVIELGRVESHFFWRGRGESVPIFGVLSFSFLDSDTSTSVQVQGACCVCNVIPSILDVRLVDVPVGGHTGGRPHRISPPSFFGAWLIFLAKRIQPFLSLVDRGVDFCVLTNQSFSTCWAFFYFFVRKNLSSCDCTGIRAHVPASEGFEVHQLSLFNFSKTI